MLISANRKLLIILLLIWMVLGYVYVDYIKTSRYIDIENELNRETTLLLRTVSQRVDQHAAHLTSLSTLAVASEQPQRDLFLQVAGAIRQFYPRVTAVDLVSIDSGSVILTTRDTSIDLSALSSVIQAAAKTSTGKFMLLPSSVSAGRYLIVKRSPNSKLARFGLALEIDARTLLKSESAFWQQPNTLISISLPDGRKLLEQDIDPLVAQENIMQPLTTSNALSSRTQPLLLTTQLNHKTTNYLTDRPVLLGLGLIALLLVVIASVIRLQSRTRSAELRARLGEHGARIAHASRVNSLGEIASGMAHELTQPLTAILSQSQAGVHLVARGESSLKAIGEILQANVAQAKRADNILSRLRDWTRQSPALKNPQSLNDCIKSVSLLLANEARRLMIDVSVKADSNNPLVIGDTVEIEQVIFNLMRNSMEALESGKNTERHIQLSSSVSADHAIVEVLDNGPGISTVIQDRLFEPFVTSKEKGMGLGLALCERIIERMGGELHIANVSKGGVSARIILPKT